VRAAAAFSPARRFAGFAAALAPLFLHLHQPPGSRLRARARARVQRGGLDVVAPRGLAAAGQACVQIRLRLLPQVRRPPRSVRTPAGHRWGAGRNTRALTRAQTSTHARDLALPAVLRAGATRNTRAPGATRAHLPARKQARMRATLPFLPCSAPVQHATRPHARTHTHTFVCPWLATSPRFRRGLTPCPPGNRIAVVKAPTTGASAAEPVLVVDSDSDDAAEHVQGGPAKRRRQNSEHTDAALARQLQEDEALARALQQGEDKAGSDDASSRGPALKRSRAGVWSSSHDSAEPSHPVFRADGLGFWLLHTEGIKEEANSPEYVVRLRDVVVGNIQWAVISNYMFDMGWLLEEIPILKDIPCVSVLYHASDNAVPLQFRELPDNFQVFAPPLPDRYGTHHSKFLLLGYPTGIRVVVLTCNHIKSDHYYSTDALWAQDFPLKSSSSAGSASKWSGSTAKRAAPLADFAEPESEFEDCLVLYMAKAKWKGAEARGQRVDLRTLGMFDYSSARARLIAAVPGRHAQQEGDLWRWGQMAIRKALRAEEFDERLKGADLVLQCTSIGGLKGKMGQRFLQGLMDSLNSARGGIAVPKSDGGTRFVWPTMEEVRTSTKGYIMGGSIPGRLQNVWEGDAKKLLQPLYCRFSSASLADSRSGIDRDPWGRGRAMPHIKTFLRHVGTEIAWLFLSSFNLSGAAWGKLEKNDSQLHIMSYEMGVLLVPSLLPSAEMACNPAFSCTSSPLFAPSGGESSRGGGSGGGEGGGGDGGGGGGGEGGGGGGDERVSGTKMRMVAGTYKVCNVAHLACICTHTHTQNSSLVYTCVNSSVSERE